MRAAANQATSAGAQATGASSVFGNRAGNAYESIFPFLKNELTATHTFTPQQEGEMMTAAAGGAGGATSGLAGELGLRAARTRNAAGYTGALDSLARAKQQALAKTGEGIAAKDAMLTEANKQNAARGMAGLYGADTSGMLRAMSLVPQDIDAAARANSTGWFQNMVDLLNSGGRAAGGSAALIKALG